MGYNEESETKDIAKLDFNVNDAINSLERVQKAIDELNNKSEKKFTEISNNYGKLFKNYVNISPNVLKQLEGVQNVSKKDAQKLVANIMKNEQDITATKKKELEKRLTIEKNANAKLLVSEGTTADKLKLKQADISNYKEKQSIKSANTQIAQNNRVLKSTETLSSRISQMAQTYLAYQGFNQLRQAAKETIEEMVQVQYKMVEIQRVLNDSSLDIDNYRDKLIQLAYDYGNSFDNVADITLRLAQAGFNANESLMLTEKTLLALNTAELNATQATSDMVAVMSQFGMMTGDANEKAENYGNIIDKINKVADNFPTTSEDILNALKKTSSAFNLAGASIDETIAMITTAEIASQRGGKAIGTAMNNIIMQLQDSKRFDIMEGMGLDVFADEAKTELKPIIEIITELSEKMQELKNAGKENTVEMQELLSVFTVFRRNIGAGLLSGVAGEDSTYMDVLETSLTSYGYSLEENEKHLRTAKAAQEQFNATLLKLKTTVWDNGLEDVFRGMLLLGNDVTEAITTLTKTFGTLPVSIGMVTLAFSTFNKNLKVKNIKEIITEMQRYNQLLKAVSNDTKKFNISVNSNNESFKNYISGLNGASASLKGYTGYLITSTAKTALLTAGTIALNAALSFGLSAAITIAIGAINKLIHAEEERNKKNQENIDKAQEETEKIQKRINTINELINAYKNLNDSDLSEEDKAQKQLELNIKLNEILKEHNIIIDSSLDTLDKKIEKLKEIEKQELRNEIISKRQELEAQKEANKSYLSFSEDTHGFSYKLKQDYGLSRGDFNDLSFEKQLDLLKEYREELEKTGGSSKSISYINEKIKELEENEKNLIPIQNELNEKMVEYLSKGMIDNISSLEDYEKQLEVINNMELMPGFIGTLEEQKEYFEYFLAQAFPEYASKVGDIATSTEAINSSFSAFASELETLSSQFDMVTKAVDEFNQYGSISASTFKQIADNNLIEYLDVVNGKMVVNKQYFEDAAESKRQDMIATLEDEAAQEILNIVTADLNGTLEETKQAGDEASTGIATAAQTALNSAKDFIQGKIAAQEFSNALKELNGKEVGDVSGLSKNALKQIDDVFIRLDKNKAKINALSKGVTRASKAAAVGAKDTAKSVEDSMKQAVSAFKKGLEDIESLEKSWVNKYKKLDLFSTSDLKFITHQRINRYNEYLNQINQLTGISEEDRAELVREYSSKRQEAELEYFDLLKQQLEDQIKEYEDANKKRIEQIKDEAQARIDALKKVDKENDRIKQKEEYERKRQELISGNKGIEYWSQRTGREAQEALLEAKKELEELDRDWNEKKEEWTLEEQIEEIEKARDAQIEAVEKAQEVQIQAWRDAYNEQVRLYAETGQIIYDDSVIQAGYLYNAYMSNFVTPLNSRIQELINGFNQATAAAVQTAEAAAAAKRADEEAARKAANTPITPTYSNISNSNVSSTNGNVNIIKVPNTIQAVSKLPGILSSNHTIDGSNIYSNLRKKIGKFHGGGKVGGPNDEALALLRKNEVVLTPEWARGVDKLVQRVNNNENIINNNNSNTTEIEVNGNMVNIDAKINNQQNADYLTKNIEKVLKEKFNIKK